MRIIALISFAYLLFVTEAMAQNNICIPGACGGSQNNTSLRHNNVHSVGDGDHALNQTYNNTLCGLTYVTSSAKITTRYSNVVNTPLGVGTGFPCTLPAISGIPTCYTVDKAYIYWTESYESGASTTPTVNFTNPSSVTNNYPATLIGTDVPKCWTSEGEIGTYAFRADVTSAITGNGTYTINNIAGSVSETTAWEVDGATLIIIYRDLSASATWKGSLIIDDGLVTYGGGTFNNTMTGFSACGTGSNSTAFLMVSDLQDNVTVTFSPTLNGTVGTFPGLFWNYCEVSTTVPSGLTSSTDYLSTSSDCFAVCATGLYFQTTTCGTCSPTVLTLDTFSTPENCSGCNGTASVTASGGASPYTYIWSTTPTQTTDTATNLCAGTYTVTVTSSGGCLTSTASATVTSNSTITLSVAPTAPVVCSGNPVTLRASGASTYSWSPPTGLSATTGATVVANPTSPTTYTIIGISGTCSDTIIVLVDVKISPTVIASVSLNPICGGTPTTLSVSGANTYSWSYGLGTSNTVVVTPSSSITYTVTGTDINGCTGTAHVAVTVDPTLIVAISSNVPVLCYGQSNGQATASEIGGTPTYSYNWSDGESTNPAVNLPVGVHTVTVTDIDGCTGTAVDTITQPSLIGITLTPDSAKCYGGATGSIISVDTGGTPTYHYLWSNGQTGQNLVSAIAGVYTVTLTDHNGCTDVASAQILQPTQLTYNVAAGGTDTVLKCGGPGTNIGSISINVVGGTYPWNFHWSNGDSTQDIMNLSGGIYTITITDHNGCTIVRTFYISQPSPLDIHIDSLDALCRDSCDGEVTSAVTGGTPFSTGNYTYSWSNGQTTENIDNLCHGIYDLTVTDSNGCQKILATHVGIKTNLIVSFTTSPTSGYVPLNVNFFYNGTTSSSNIYLWTFGDGSIDTTETPPPHIYNSNYDTTFKVCLQVSDSACKYDTCELVKVEIHSMIKAPNVFMPGDVFDQNNATFHVQDTSIATFNCIVFNRWGNKVYEWSDVNSGWDGGNSPSGTYFYIITAKGYDNVTYNLHGAVMLLRSKK